jgi:membrane fusion protein (multidrug efflux system)
MESKDTNTTNVEQAVRKNPGAPQIAEEEERIDDVPLFRKKRVIIPLFLVLLGAAVGGYYWYMNLQNYVSTDDAYVSANSVSISTKMLGRIVYLGTDEGDSVRLGQVLIRLDDHDLRAQEASAKAGLLLAQESIPLEQVQVDRAKDDFNRAQVQYKSGITTKEQYDHAQKSLEAARAQLSIANARIVSARSQLGVVESELENTIITSPIDGVVAKRWVLTGGVVQPGQPVFTIYDLKDLWITANLEETKLGYIKLNDPVEIDVDAYPSLKFEGKVFEIGTFTASEFSLIPPDNASGNFTKVTQRVPIKISVQNTVAPGSKAPVLRPGMSVEVSVRIK